MEEEGSSSSNSSSSSSVTNESWRDLAARWSKMTVSPATASFFFVLLFVATLVSTQWSNIATFTSTSMQFTFSNTNTNSRDYPRREEYLLNCTSSGLTLTCPANYPPTNLTRTGSSPNSCPDYFRWIHENLSPWKQKGITRDMVESLKKTAHFRVIIVNGTAYVKQYQKAFQTRDVFNLWGILQLMKLYPGQIPDLDLMFQCHDQSSIKRRDYEGKRAAKAPPQFHYCADESTLDFIFPDWSFWGWPEVNIKPWVSLMEDLEAGNRMKNWSDREPYAYWKGNLYTGSRQSLAHCNSTTQWNAVIINQDWGKENREGFKNSDLSKQCVHRYKIYMEGNAWSVSEKYILACDSMSLLIKPRYYDFFTRSLVPMTHYWPVNPNNLCPSIKFAARWGNNHSQKAQEIGKAGSGFIREQLTMDNVYDYMFHLLTEYSKLFKYKPTVPEGAVELCSEQFACSPMGLETEYKKKTMVSSPAQRRPCTLPPPYDRDQLKALRSRKAKIMQEVEKWEKSGKI